MLKCYAKSDDDVEKEGALGWASLPPETNRVCVGLPLGEASLEVELVY